MQTLRAEPHLGSEVGAAVRVARLLGDAHHPNVRLLQRSGAALRALVGLQAPERNMKLVR